MDYKEDMHIDENALDVEFLEQPELMVKYSTMLAEVKQSRDLRKENLDFISATIDKEIRADPDVFDLDKLTETIVKNTVIMQGKYKEAMNLLIDSNFEVNVLQGVVNAIDARKSSLENLVKLHGQEYFAGPSIPHDLSALRKEKSEEIHHSVGKTFRRTKPKK